LKEPTEEELDAIENEIDKVEALETQEIGRAEIIMDILYERQEAFKRWGDQDTRDNPLWLAIVDARTSYIEESMDEPEDLYLEIIQAATILVAWAEAVKRKELNDVE
jgi:hypothetical protein|tara:strand:+ start:161 stop:481 length:321 start_codon:yes stop_codon:yes gene_type:complete